MMAQRDNVFEYSKMIIAIFGGLHARSSTDQLSELIEVALSQGNVRSKRVMLRQDLHKKQPENIQRGFTSSGRPELGEFWSSGSQVQWRRLIDGAPTIYTPPRASAEDVIQDYVHCFLAQDKFLDSIDRINAMRSAAHQLQIKMIQQMRVHKSCNSQDDLSVQPYYLRWNRGSLCVSDR